MRDRYADLDESAAWNDAMNRRDIAVRQLRQFGTARPEYRFECLRRAILLNMRTSREWPLGGHGGN